MISLLALRLWMAACIRVSERVWNSTSVINGTEKKYYKYRATTTIIATAIERKWIKIFWSQLFYSDDKIIVEQSRRQQQQLHRCGAHSEHISASVKITNKRVKNDDLDSTHLHMISLRFKSISRDANARWCILHFQMRYLYISSRNWGSHSLTICLIYLA